MATERNFAGCSLVLVIATSFLCSLDLYKAIPQWPMNEDDQWVNYGGDLNNRRYNAKETKISPKTASNFHLKWNFETTSFISGTPTIYNGTIYFPSFDGYIYAINENDGSLVWKHYLHNLTGLDSKGLTFDPTLLVSRTTPSIAGPLLILGLDGPAVVLGLRRDTGILLWMTELESHLYSVIAISGTYYNGGFYTGVSHVGYNSDINCCTFRGSFAKLDAYTGKIIWQRYMLPGNKGKQGEYAGAAIWGSSPSIDIPRNHVYITTGYLTSIPERVKKCREKLDNQTNLTHSYNCIEPDNHFDSILALDLDTGDIQWSHQFETYVWFIRCGDPFYENCPTSSVPIDFGEAPMLLTVHINGSRKDLAVAIQRSGLARALDRDTGDLVWSTDIGPRGDYGGAATDGKRVYTQIQNSNAENFTLKPSNKIVTSGGWVAIDAKNGEILWSTANPSNTSASSPVSIANDVMFAASFDYEGGVFALDAETGSVLWSYETGRYQVYNGFGGGVSIRNGCIYVGNGAFSESGGLMLFAFCV